MLIWNIDNFYSNVSMLGDKRILEKLTHEGGLSLKASVNMKNTEEDRQEHLKGLQDALGLAVDVTLDLEVSEIAKAADARGYNDRVGELINAYLKGLLENFQSHAKDEMIKESLASNWSTGVIKGRFVSSKTAKKGESVESYNNALFEGDLQLV